MEPQRKIHFGPFELDPETGELKKGGGVVKLSPKPCRVLSLLAQAPGRLITREMLRRELWDSNTHVDFEHALNFCIREVRAALGDDAKKPNYIETLARRGYRFIAETRTEVAEIPTASPQAPNGDEAHQLEAYAHYQSARKHFGQAGKEGLENARRDFRRAIEILPGYALAHSGLGAASALCSLNRRDPKDLDAALLHLTKALELDPELAEPYPWLCYVLMRRNRFEAAVQAGLRGVELQPDMVAAHYFLGLAYFAGSETDAAHYESAARHLLNAIRVDPQWQPAWYVLSYLCLSIGEYEQAEFYAQRLLDMGPPLRGTPFIGGEITLGAARLRQGDVTGARGFLLGFLERMLQSDHMYRDALSSAAACELGDAELRHGSPSAALAAYRRAWHTLQEYPRVAAYQRIAARAQAGLAAAYAATEERRRAADLLESASRLTQESESMEHNAAGANIAEVYWTIATAWMRLGDRAAAIESLARAVRTGWRDALWMERDPEFRALEDSPDFQRLLREIREWRGVPSISAVHSPSI